MFRSWVIGIFCLLSAAASGLAQPGRDRQERPSPMRGPRAGVPGPNREMLLERWSQMTPQQRRRALEKLPPERRQRIERQLQLYQEMTPEERERVRSRMRAFEDLTPEQREERRRLFRRFTSLPDDRRPVVRREFERLRDLPEEDRRARLESEEFRHRFSLEEQHLLREMTEVAAEGSHLPEPRP